MTELLTALFEGIRDMSLTAAWAAGLVFLARLLLKNRAPRRVLCLLWLVVFARLLVPVKLESPVSLVPPALSEGMPGTMTRPGGRVPLDSHEQNAPAGVTVGPASPGGSPDTANGPYQAPVGAGGLVSDSVGDGRSPQGIIAPDGPSQTPVGPADQSPFPWKALLAGIWLAGAVGMLCCGLVTYVRLRRRVRFAVRVADRVWEDDTVASPFILGLFRPRVYLPAGLEGRARRFILCHEFAHLRRLDHVVKPICWFALALHWFNPAVWVAFLLLGRDMEGACDEAVLRSLGEEVKADYSYTLLALASGKRIPAPCPLAFDEGDAKGRIKNVLNYRKPALWIVVVSVIAVIVAAVCLLTNPVAEKPDDTNSPAPTESGPGPSQTPDEGLNDLLDPWMLEVLRGERTFSVYGTDRDIDHLAQTFFGDEVLESLELMFNLALLDLDRDGTRELVIDPGDSYNHITGYLILRQEGDTVQGYRPYWRSIGGLKADGTSRWSSSAANWGTGRAYFEGGDIRTESIAWCDGSFETGETNYYVEGQPVTQEEFNAAIAAQEAQPEPFWYTFENGVLCARVTIPVDDNVVVPSFLDADQQLLYRQAYSLYGTLFGPSTEMIDWWPGPVELPPAEPVEADGYTYVPSTGLFARWEDLEYAALSVFTPEFWEARNTWLDDGGNPHQTYINVDGRTYYRSAARGCDGTNPNFPDTFHLPEQSDTEITFVLTGHYSERRPLPGESNEERDARYADHWEEYIGYPMKLVKTENGWRFDEFHCAASDIDTLPYANQAAPNPALTDSPEPAGGACVHGLDHVYVDHLTDGRLVFRCMEDFFPYYPPFPCAYDSDAIWEGDCDGDGHIEEIVRSNNAGTLMLCDVVPLDGQPVYGGKYGEMKTFIFDPFTRENEPPGADLSSAWFEPGDELVYCVPLRPSPNAASTGTVELHLRYDGTALTEELCSLPPPSPAP